MADLSGASDDIEKFIEAVRKATSSLSDGTNLADELRGEEKDSTRAVIKEFDKLGGSLKDHDKVVDKDTASLKERAKNEKLVNDQLIASGKIRADATKEEIEAYKLTQKQNEAFRAQLEAMGKYLNETGKVIDTTVRLSAAQQTQVNKEKINSEKQNKQDQNKFEVQKQLATTFSAVGLAGIALKAGFDLLLAGVQGTYQGMLAMQEMSLAGVEDDTKRAAGAAKVAESLASTYNILGIAALAAAARLVSLGGPTAWVLGGIAAAAGLAAKALGAEKELEAIRGKQQAEQSKNLFLGFQKLSNASLVGAEGITGLFNDLQKMGLTVSQFEKFNKVVSGSGKELAMFSGTTIAGAKEFSKQAGELLKSDFGKTLEIMGIGAEEQFQHQMSFMTIQSQFGLKVNGDIKKATYNYIAELDKIAVLTGATRKEQETERKYIMSMNQLRAAMIEAEIKGDKAKLAELKLAAETAARVALVDKQAAEGLAKFFAAGGAVDEASARAFQVFGGADGVIEKIKSGNTNITESYSTAVKQLYAMEGRFASTTKTNGGIAGVTSTEPGGVGKIADANTALMKAEKAATENNKTISGLIDWLKTNISEETKLQVERMRRERADNLNADIMTKAGYQFGDATKLQLEAAKDFISGNSIFSMAANSLAEVFKKLIPVLSGALSAGGTAVVGAAKGVASSISGAASSALGGITSAFGGGAAPAASGGAASGGAASGGAASGGAASGDAASGGAASGGAVPEASMQRMNLSVPNAAGPAAVPEASMQRMNLSVPNAAGPAAASAAAASTKPSGSVQKLLDYIGIKEARGQYDMLVGGKSKSDLTSMTVAQVMDFQKEMLNSKKFETSAVGKYQIVKKTLAGLVNNGVIKLDDIFNSTTQDKAAIGLLKEKGLDAYQNGKLAKDIFADRVAKVWASLPLASGKSAHDGVGSNKAGGSRAEYLSVFAKEGGIANGPMSGYPATLHGNEIISPLSPNSILEQLGKTSVASVKSIINSSSNSSTTNNNNDILNGLFDMMVSKLDTVIDKLDSGNDISKKIVKAMA